MTCTRAILVVACLISAGVGVAFESGAHVAPVAQEAPAPKVTQILSKNLIDLPGKEAVMLTVEYPPGGADPVHRHYADASVYVLEGSIVMQLRDGPETLLTVGQTFYEGPDDVHIVGRNASQTEPARFVVFLVKDIGTPALVPVN